MFDFSHFKLPCCHFSLLSAFNISNIYFFVYFFKLFSICVMCSKNISEVLCNSRDHFHLSYVVPQKNPTPPILPMEFFFGFESPPPPPSTPLEITVLFDTLKNWAYETHIPPWLGWDRHFLETCIVLIKCSFFAV